MRAEYYRPADINYVKEMKLISDKTNILLNLFVPQRQKPDPNHAIQDSDKDLSGKTIVITGGTDGIGRAAARMLYEMGANVLILGRNKAKGEAVVDECTATGGQGTVSLQLCDFSSMNCVKACAKRILTEHGRIDILINNAGVNMTEKIITEDGFETNWAVNYLGPYLLTNLLLKRIQESAPSRVVNLTTNTEFIDHIDVDEIQAKPNFDTGSTYVESKLSMNMFSMDLAQKFEGAGVTVNYLCPGHIKSNLLSNLTGAEKIMGSIISKMASPAEVGADRIVRLAVSSEFQSVTGTYVCEDRIKPHHPEALISEKRQQIRRITENALAQWL